MRNPPLSSDVEIVVSTMDAVRTALAAGDSIAAEEGLVDAYNRISKMLRNVEVHERRGSSPLRASVALWRNEKSI
jgi:hypothetical protein